MNTHSLNRKLKIALIRRSSEQGFAMPVALGLGLVMLLVGATMIVRSQGDRVTSSAQSATASSLSAAETGIARYQSLINLNRAIAMYSACQTNTWDAISRVCSDPIAPTDPIPSWRNASKITLISTCTTSPLGSGASKVSDLASRQWQDVDAGDPSKGQYRLWNYTYNGTPGSTGGTGTLIVDGRVTPGSVTSANTDVGTSTTRLQVNLPVVNNAQYTRIPGLWVTDNTNTTTLGGQKVIGNIVIYDCTPPGNKTSITSSNIAPIPPSTTTLSGSIYVTKDLTFPTTPSMTASGTPNSADGTLNYDVSTTSSTINTAGIWSNSGSTQTPQYNVLSGGKWYTSLPRRDSSGKILDSKFNDKYYYVVDSLDSSGNKNLFIDPDPTIQVVIFVRGDINLAGGSTINSPGFPNRLQIYGNTYDPPGSLTNTKYGCPSVSGKGKPSGTTCPTLNVAIDGGATISALILAPDATGSVSGGGSSNCSNVFPPYTTPPTPPQGNFVGALWTKSYKGNSSLTVVCSYGNLSDYVATSQQAIVGIPDLAGWQRQEVTP